MKTILISLIFFQIGLGQKPNFEAQSIDIQVSIGYGIAIGDVDGDKKPDILLADQKQFVWYRNGDWKRFVMIENLTERDNVCIAARDIDGDGKVEVAVGANWNPSETNDLNKSGSVHYLIAPKDPTQKWDAVKLHHEVTIHRLKWIKVAKNRFQLIVVPLHGLGNKNGVGKGVNIWAYEVPKKPQNEWKRTLVDSSMHMTHNFEIVEGNVPKLAIGGKEGINVFELNQNKWSKTQHLVDNPTGEIKLGNVDNAIISFSPTIVSPMHGNKLVTFDKNRKEQLLTDNLNQGHALAVADFLGNGRKQIVVGWREPNKDKKVGIKMFSQNTMNSDWDEFIIDDNQMACEDMQVADLNGDGKLDIIASGRATKNLVIYWNKN
ncbi:MAG: VCBS repeat-containing protein [Bacteroidota bacterium]